VKKSSGKKSLGSRGAGHEADLDPLCDAFLQLKTRNECKKFLLDLCTPAEISAFAERWKVARLLDEKQLSYRDIYEQTGVSVTTIGRVARFLDQEPNQGYHLVLRRLYGTKQS